MIRFSLFPLLFFILSLFSRPIYSQSTEWKGITADWNDDSNWTNGAPIHGNTLDLIFSSTLSANPNQPNGVISNNFLPGKITFNGFPSQIPFSIIGTLEPSHIFTPKGIESQGGENIFGVEITVFEDQAGGYIFKAQENSTLIFTNPINMNGDSLTVSGNGSIGLNGVNRWGQGKGIILSNTISNTTLSVGNASAFGEGGTNPEAASFIDCTNSTIEIGNKYSTLSNFTITSIPITISNSTLTVNTNGNHADIKSVISESNGSSILEKTGAGTLALAGSNTYSGGTKISGGVLNIQTVNNLGTGSTLTIGEGTLQVANSLTLSGFVTITGTDTNPSTIDTGANKITVSGAISGPGYLNIIGMGTLFCRGIILIQEIRR